MQENKGNKTKHLGCVIKLILAALSPNPETLADLDCGVGTNGFLLESQARGRSP